MWKKSRRNNLNGSRDKSRHFIWELMQWLEGDPDNKIHGAIMGPTWLLSAQMGPHFGPMNLAIREEPWCRHCRPRKRQSVTSMTTKLPPDNAHFSAVLWYRNSMMTSSNGNIFRVTGPLCGEFTGPGEFPTKRPATRSFDVFFDLRLNKWLSIQPWGWWFETPVWSLWRDRNAAKGSYT